MNCKRDENLVKSFNLSSSFVEKINLRFAMVKNAAMIFIYKLCFLMLPLFSAKASTPAPHPFYVCITEIDHNAKVKTLEISHKFFADDFEKTIEKNYRTKLDISAARDKASLDKFIPDYINKHFQLSTDGKSSNPDFVGYEVEKGSVYCYFEVANVSAVKKLEVSSSLLQDFTKEQANLVHVTVNGKRHSSRITASDRKASFVF